MGEVDGGVESVEVSGSEEDGGETAKAQELADVASEQKSEDDHQMEDEKPVVRKHGLEQLTEKSRDNTGEEEEEEVAVKKVEVSLVPYQDSSATEVEQIPSAESGTEIANIQPSSGANRNSLPATHTRRGPLEDGMDEITLHTEETLEGDGADMDVECPSQNGKGEGQIDKELYGKLTASRTS